MLYGFLQYTLKSFVKKRKTILSPTIHPSKNPKNRKKLMVLFSHFV